MGVQNDTEIIPGTELVFRGTSGEADSSQELVLIPQPTNNKDDPLNWGPAWKTILIVNQFVFVFVSILTPLAIAPLTELFMVEFDKTLPQVNLLFGVAAIVLGYANFLIVPLANVYGRRPIIILCGLVCVLANIWQALVTSFPSFLGARVISGLGAAANESIMPMVVADLFFVHQRGRSMTLYFWSYFLGIFIGPVIAGSIAARASWRWFFWVCAILQGASLLFIIVAHPETKYDRSTAATSVHTPASGSAEVVEHGDGPEKHTSAAATPPASDDGRDSSKKGQQQEQQKGQAVTATITATSSRPVGGPSRAQFGLLPPLGPRAPLLTTTTTPRGGWWRALAREVATPARAFALPIVLWASLTMGFASNCLLALNLTESQVFAAPPYGFGSASIGYTNFAFAAGAAVALATAGPLGDALALRRARRNGGVLEPEFRLWGAAPYAAACLVGMVVTAVGYQRGWAWEVVVVVGYGLVGVQTVGLPAVVIAYAVDCYKTLPGEIMIAATVIKNSFGFAMVFFFNDWAARQGYIAPVLTLMAATVGLSVLGLAIFIPYGKKFRRATMNSSLHSI